MMIVDMLNNIKSYVLYYCQLELVFWMCPLQYNSCYMCYIVVYVLSILNKIIHRTYPYFICAYNLPLFYMYIEPTPILYVHRSYPHSTYV